MPLDMGRLGRDDYVEFLLFHKDLGQLPSIRPTQVYRSQFQPFAPDGLLIEALKYFEGGQHLQEYLSKVQPVKGQQPMLPFEAGVLLTLAAINLRHVPLMVFRDAESIHVEGQSNRSADIIALDPDLGLLVIDCTTGVPSDQKIQRLRNTVQYLGSLLPCACRGILICSENVDTLRRNAEHYGLAFVQADQLLGIWNHAHSGNTVLALNHFRGLIGQPPAAGRL
jgi:hypothetical protein